MSSITRVFAVPADLYGPLVGAKPDHVWICVDREGTDKQQQIPMTIEMALVLQKSLADSIVTALQKRMDYLAPDDPAEKTGEEL